MALSVFTEASAELTVLGSRFIGIAFPLDDGEAFGRKMEEIKARYPKATHYCYAYRYGTDERCSDDGEPSKTAGLPMLSLLKGRDLEDAGIIVVRYFGGTKLGVGRLLRSYKEAASLALKNAKICELADGFRVEASLSYPEFEGLRHELSRLGCQIDGTSFGEKATIVFEVDGKILKALEGEHPELASSKREKMRIRRVKEW
jgi:uncharacterized YigZ family protein